MNYIVMECHPGYVILLDEAGRFFRAANLQYEVGQRVSDPVLLQQAKPAKKRGILRWLSRGAVAAAAALVVLFGWNYYQNNVMPYTSIYLSINPEVRILLNRRGTVVHLEGTNADGKKLLEGYDGKGKDKTTAAEELVDRAIEMGFLSEGGCVSFSIDAPDDVLFQEYETALQTGVTRHLSGRMTIVIEITDSAGSPETSQSQSTQQTASSQAQSSLPDTGQTGTENPGRSQAYQDSDYGSDYDDPATDYAPDADSSDYKPKQDDSDYYQK